LHRSWGHPGTRRNLLNRIGCGHGVEHASVQARPAHERVRQNGGERLGTGATLAEGHLRRRPPGVRRKLPGKLRAAENAFIGADEPRHFLVGVSVHVFEQARSRDASVGIDRGEQ
jgi:hypothetical protein